MKTEAEATIAPLAYFAKNNVLCYNYVNVKHTHTRHQNGGETGGMFEMNHLYPSNDPRRRVLANIDALKVEYRSFAAAILECIEKNPARFEGSELWDPPTGWLRDVHYAIVEKLKLKNWKNLVMMPTLKTSADVHHGIDLLVIYNEPDTDREVIVSVDLSLRQKETFKADVLVTDTSVIPNDYYYATPRMEIPDKLHASKREDEMIEEERRRAIGTAIADIIDEKLTSEDPHYGQTIRNIGNTIRHDVAELLEVTRGKAPGAPAIVRPR